jgi:hypothetical protein
MNYYKDYPQRIAAEKYKSDKYNDRIKEEKLFSEKNIKWPVDDSDEGCTDTISHPHTAWTKQTDLIEIKSQDIISDDGAEIAGYFKAKGIKNVILTGVHTNMCVVGRTFGLRNMVRLGMNAVLMRDLTDAMYNPKSWPYVSHFKGVDLVVDYIEKYICPTIVSTDFTSDKPFRFTSNNGF